MVVVKKRKKHWGEKPNMAGRQFTERPQSGWAEGSWTTQSCIYSIYSQAVGQELQVQREPASPAQEAAGPLRCERLGPGPQQLCLL